jgi:cytoskeletal protein CcmA (bactofilin family)
MLKSSSLEAVRSDETTIITHGVRIEGKVSSDGNIIVDGKIKGDIICKNNVNIGEGGEVNGHISANLIVIAGNVVGTVSAKEKLSLEPKGNIKGDITTKTLVVEAGAKFDGNIKMGNFQENFKLGK